MVQCALWVSHGSNGGNTLSVFFIYPSLFTPNSSPGLLTGFSIKSAVWLQPQHLRVFSLLFKQSLYCLFWTSKRHPWLSPNLYNPISLTLSLATLKDVFLKHAWFCFFFCTCVFVCLECPFAPFHFAQLHLPKTQCTLRSSLILSGGGNPVFLRTAISVFIWCLLLQLFICISWLFSQPINFLKSGNSGGFITGSPL